MSDFVDISVPFTEEMNADAIARNAGNNVQAALSGDNALRNYAAQNESINAHNAQQRAIQEGYSPAQRASLSNVYGRNLRDNPLGNLNNMSAEDTLAASRAADARNNRQRFMQGDIGARTFSMGSSGIEDPRLERVSPVETQETRQMRANEALDAYARQRQAGLAADIEAHSLELQQQRDNNIMQIAQSYGITDPTIMSKIRNLYTDLSWATPTQLAQQLQSADFMNKIRANFGDRMANFYYQVYQEAPFLIATRATQNGIALPTIDKRIMESTVYNVLNRSDLSPQEKLTYYNMLCSTLTSNAAQVQAAAFQGGLWGGGTVSGTAKAGVKQQNAFREADLKTQAEWDKLTAKYNKKAQKLADKRAKLQGGNT